MSSRASRGMGMGMEKTGLGVDLLEELLARHRRREHAEGAFSRADLALGGRRRAAVRERRTKAVFFVSSSHPPLAFEGLKVRSDLELVRPIVVSGRW